MNQERHGDIPLEQLKPYVQVYAIASNTSVEYSLMGHGHLTLLTDEFIEGNAYYIQVVKNNDDILLRSRLKRHNNYQKQKDTVIVWRDDELRNHQQLALSFEEEYEADFFWRLICEKIGQNYLNINPKDILQMPNQNNLHQILEKTKNSKGMVEYHLLHSTDFLAALHLVFESLMTKKDKYGLGMIHKIIKSICKNIDYRLVECLFGELVFEMILQLQKLNRKINYPQLWTDYIKVKRDFSLPQKTTAKIIVIHKIQFYREHFVDVVLDPYFNYILILTQTECSKAIIKSIIDEEVLEKIVQFKAGPDALNYNYKKDQLIDQQTCEGQMQEIARKRLFQQKISFFMETILMAKITNDVSLKQKLLDKMYLSAIISMFVSCIDRNIVKIIYFFICLAQANPSQLFSFLKQNHKISSINNQESLIQKLAKKYCTCLEDFQNSILEILSYFVQDMKIQQNISFMNKYFYNYVLKNFKDGKSLITILNEVMTNAVNIQFVLEQVVKDNIFKSIMSYIRQQGKEKLQDIKILKILKRIIKQNVQRDSKDNTLMQSTNRSVIQSGFFEYCMVLLMKNINKNNIFSSIMLGILKQLKSQRFELFRKYLKQNKCRFQSIQQLIENAIIDTAQNKKMAQQQFGGMKQIKPLRLINNQQQVRKNQMIECQSIHFIQVKYQGFDLSQSSGKPYQLKQRIQRQLVQQQEQDMERLEDNELNRLQRVRKIIKRDES